MEFSTTNLDWAIISIAVVIMLATVNVVFILKLMGLERWQIRKIGHTILNTVAAFIPYLFTNIFDLFLALIITIGTLLLFSLIPQIRILQRIFFLCSRNDNSPWELFINSTLMGAVMLLILWFFQDNLFVFTAAYLTVSLGDGLGELIGKPFGSIKYKILSEKSLEGSLGVLFGSLLGITIALAVNSMLGWPGVWWKIIVVAVISMIVEALSFSFIDNITLPSSVTLALYLLFLL